ncbi:MAG: haloacid dehalogenase-like hydrolase [Ruminococcaceae bacterium]|nr:haloacid dehalogenase-like hydrolase [Oscillospiraceae bacterium]
MSKPIVAFMYDFDKTLCTENMQEYTFIPSIGMGPNEFWDYTAVIAKEETMDRVLTYMYCMVEKAKESGNPLTREAMVACGKDIEYHPGVEDWFERINRYGEDAGVQVEHYVLSSGLKEIIEGTSIAKYFERIYACEFLYKDGQAYWPKMAVNYTNKTQFVYRINKGVLDIDNDVDLNSSRPDSQKRVFFSNMIYIGDGLTDVPCMKLVKQSGGHSVALYQPGKAHKTAPLLKHDRVDWMFEADFSEGSELDTTMKILLENLARDSKLKTLHSAQKNSISD